MLDNEVHRLDELRQTYEIQIQRFRRFHDYLVMGTITICIILILSGAWWVSGFAVLVGALIIYFMKKRIVSAMRQISEIDREMRRICLQIITQTRR
jgi:hypothetical protein